MAGDLLELVALRNQAARKLGFSDYFVMRLYLGEQNEEQVFKLFDELEQLTREPFHQAKAEFDAALATAYGITVDELAAVALSRPVFSRGAGGRGRDSRVGFQVVGHRGRLPFILRRHRLAGGRHPAAERLLREAGQESARLLVKTSTARATSACCRTSCPTKSG